MSFTLPWSINKLVSTNINNANSVTGTYTNVSLKVNGKSELSDDTTISRLGVGKNTNSSYAIDASGNMNISGNYYQNGTIFSPTGLLTSNNTWSGTNSFNTSLPTSTQTPSSSTQLITKTYGDTTYGSISGNNTWSATNTFSKINMTNGFNNQQALVVTDNFNSVSNLLVMTFNSYDTIVCIPSSTIPTFSIITVILPTITTSNIGAKVRIMLGGPIVGGIYGFQIMITNNTTTQQIFYNGTKYITLPIDVGYGSPTGFPVGYELVAVNTSQVWAVTSVTWSPNIMTQINNNWTGTNTFNSSLPTSTQTPSSSTQLITKAYGDATYGTISGTNNWSGINTFNTNLPTSTQTPSSSTQLITKAYGDATYGRLTSGLTNTWASTNNFSTSSFSVLPTSNDLVTIPGNFTIMNKQQSSAYFPDKSSGVTNFYGSTNTFNGNTNFNVNLPQSSIVSTTTTSATQFLTRGMNDLRYGQILTGVTNTWASTNIFSVLPSSTDTTTTPVNDSLIRKQYADATYQATGSYGTISGTNNWSGLNTFNTILPTSTLTPTTGAQLITRTYADTRYNLLGQYTNQEIANKLINPWFQLPLVTGTNIAYYLVSSSTTDYAPNSSTLTALGFTGWGFQHSGTQQYSAAIQSGTGGTYYLTNYPFSYNQCLVLAINGAGSSVKLYSETYTGYGAGVYNLGFWLCGGGFYYNSYIVAKVYSSGTLIFTSPNINVQGSFPTWQYLTYDLTIATNTGVYVSFDFYQDPTNSAGYYACIMGVILTGYNGFVFSDSTGTSVIAGTNSLLNSLSVNNGFAINSGGISSIGQVNFNTTYGLNNIAISNSLGDLVGSNNTNCVSIGSGSLGGATGANNCTIVGGQINGLTNTSNPSDLVVIGSNCQTGNQSQSVFIGSGIQSPTSTGGNNAIGYNIGGGQNGLGGDYNSILGNNCFTVYNGYNTLTPSYNCAIGHSSQNKSADYYNVSVGAFSLQNMAGVNGVSGGATTQYNTAIGYNSGKTYALLNNCTLLGAKTDLGSNNLTNATAVGYLTIVSASNTIQLGSNSETVAISGSLKSGSNTITAAQLGYLSGVSTGIVDTNSTQTIAGVKTFSSAPIMSGASITSATVGQTQISNGYVDLTSAQTSIAGVKTFTSPPVMSGASITSGTVGQTQISNGYVDLTSAQTIAGVKTFSSAPIMSGASITSATIGQTQVSNGYVALSTAQTIAGVKTFSSAPIMSGASITSATIGQTQVSNGYIDLSTAQTIAGVKTFSSAPVMSGASITSATIGQTQVSNGYVDLTTAQSSIGGDKIFQGNVAMGGNFRVTQTYANGLCPILITSATSLLITGSVYQIYNFTMTTATAFTITLSDAGTYTSGTEVTFKRIGGSLQILNFQMAQIGTSGFYQPIYQLGATQGTLGSSGLIGLISASQNTTKIYAFSLAGASSGTLGASYTSGATSITLSATSGGALIFIGTVITISGNVRQITGYGTGLGGAGTYTLSSSIASTFASGTAYTTQALSAWGQSYIA